jgi:hypothetical protein
MVSHAFTSVNVSPVRGLRILPGIVFKAYEPSPLHFLPCEYQADSPLMGGACHTSC